MSLTAFQRMRRIEAMKPENISEVKVKEEKKVEEPVKEDKKNKRK